MRARTLLILAGIAILVLVANLSSFVNAPAPSDERSSRIDRGRPSATGLRPESDREVVEDSARVFWRGRVVDAVGDAVPGAELIACGREEVLGRARAGEDGRFELTFPAGNPVTLAAHGPGRGQAVISELDGTQDQSGLRVRLRPGAVVDVLVVDEESRPVAGAEVMLCGAYPVVALRSSETDASGAARFSEVGIDLVLRVRRAGFLEALIVRLWSRVRSRRVLVRLERGVLLEGRVVDHEGLPVADAEVDLDAHDARIPRVRTDSEGRFCAAGVPRASPIRATVRAGLRGAAVTPWTRWAPGIPFVVRLLPFRVVPGRVVRIEEGGEVRGVPGLEVNCFADPYPGSRWSGRRVRTRAVSDREGRFRIAVARGQKPRLWLDSPEWAAVQPVSSEPTPDGTYRIQVFRRSRISGRVLGPDGEPVEGARVDTTGGVELGAALSGPAGRFVLRGIWPYEDATVVAERPGGGWGQTSVDLNPGEDLEDVVVLLEAGLVLGARVVDGDDRPVEGADVFHTGESPEARSRADGTFDIRVASLDRGSLRVEKEGYEDVYVSLKRRRPTVEEPLVLPRLSVLTGRIVDEAGRPVETARIRVDDFGGTVDAGPGGAFRVLSDPGDGDQLIVTAPGFASLKIRIADIPADGTVTLSPAHVIAGRVVDHDGSPLAGVDVRTTIRFGRLPQSRARTALDGSFRLEVGSPGDHELVAGLEDRQFETIPTVWPDGAAVEIRALPFRTIAGRVVDDTGRGVPDVQVEVSSGGSNRVAGRNTTDLEGAFRIEKLLGESFTLRIPHLPGTLVFAPVRVRADERDLRLVASTGLVIAGTVEDESGSEVPAIRVHATPMGQRGPYVSRDFASGRGVFRIERLLPGRYRVWVHSSSQDPRNLVGQVEDVEAGTEGLRVVVRSER